MKAIVYTRVPIFLTTPNLVKLITHSLNQESMHSLVDFHFLGGVILGFSSRDLAARTSVGAFDHAQLVTDAETSLRKYNNMRISK